MKVTEDKINEGVYKLIEEIYEYEGSENTERAFGRCMGIVGMAQEMKNVLKGVESE